MGFGQLTSNDEGNVFRDDDADIVPGVALVLSRVVLGHVLDLVKVLRRVVRDEHPVLHPTVLGLGETCTEEKITIIANSFIIAQNEMQQLKKCKAK